MLLVNAGIGIVRVVEMPRIVERQETTRTGYLVQRTDYAGANHLGNQTSCFIGIDDTSWNLGKTVITLLVTPSPFSPYR
jgi:hypothetical protein